MGWARMISRRLLMVFAVWLTLGALPQKVAAEEAARRPEVDVILWFDTEDYLLPADDGRRQQR